MRESDLRNIPQSAGLSHLAGKGLEPRTLLPETSQPVPYKMDLSASNPTRQRAEPVTFLHPTEADLSLTGYQEFRHKLSALKGMTDAGTTKAPGDHNGTSESREQELQDTGVQPGSSGVGKVPEGRAPVGGSAGCTGPRMTTHPSWPSVDAPP